MFLGVLRIEGLDVSRNIHLLDTSANNYQDRLDGIDLSVNRLDTSANNYQDRLDGIDLSVNRLDTSNYQDRLDGIDLSVNRLDTSANNYQDRLDGIDLSVNRLDTSANNYQDRLDGIDLSVNRLDTSANNYQDRLDGIDLSVNRLDTSANNYQDRLDGIDLSVNRLDTSANNYQDRLDGIDLSVNRLDTSANNYQDRLDGIDLSVNRLDTSANSYESRLDGIDLSVNRLDTSANNYQDRLDGIDLSVNRLDTSANSYEDRLDDIDISFSQTLVLNDVSANDISAVELRVLDTLSIPSRTSDLSTTPLTGSIYYHSNDNKIKVYKNNSWINLAGSSSGSSLWDSNNSIVKLTSYYNNVVDISGLDISNNLNVKGLINLGSANTSDISGSLRYTDISKVEVWYNSKWNKLTGGGGGSGSGSGGSSSTGTNLNYNQILEEINSYCNGDQIERTDPNNEITITDITTIQSSVSNCFKDWEDINGSEIYFKPIADTKYVIYTFCFAYSTKLKSEFRPFIRIDIEGVNDISYNNLPIKLKYDESDFYEVSFLININSSGPINISSWTDNKKIKLQIKDYNLSYENKSYLHGSFGWENETPRILFIKPKIKIKCIGRRENNINNISENLIGYCNGQTFSNLQDSRSISFPSVDNFDGPHSNINKDINGSNVTYKPITGIKYIEYSFEFFYFRTFVNNFTPKIELYIDNSLKTKATKYLEYNKSNQYKITYLIRTNDDGSSGTYKDNNITESNWTDNKVIKLKLIEQTNDVGSKSYIHANMILDDDRTPTIEFKQPILNIKSYN